MGIISSALLTISGVYLALGIVYLRFWWAERPRLDYLSFSLSAISITIFSWFELGMMHSQTPAGYLFYAWWFFPLTVCVTVSVAAFAYVHLGGRRWLFWTYCVFRLSGAFIHLLMPNGINFLEINSIGHLTVLGETLSYPIAVPNPWMILPHLSHLLLLIFCLDASFRAWRRGERRKALLFGTGLVFYRIIDSTVTIGVLWGLIHLPLITSFTPFILIAVMLYEMNYDMHRMAMLAQKLKESEDELKHSLYNLNVSANAANVGLWSKNLGEDKVWVSQKIRELWGFSDSTPSMMEEFARRVHPDDLENFGKIIVEAEEKETDFRVEYRIIQPDQNIRWVVSVGRVELVDEHTKALRGATVDITQRKQAEKTIRELSHKLIDAQEKERARLARELHDDLIQSTAMLSIELSILRKQLPQDEYIKEQIQRLISGLAGMAAHIRRISHDLHPARLRQLGLEAAVRGFCGEIAAAHPLEIDFEAENLPDKLPDDISLCLFRVVQESLQNAIKHSGATLAQVSIEYKNGGINLSVTDNGSGFDMREARAKESLGLISIDERVRAVKGEAKIKSTVGGGTKVEVSVPVRQ